MILIILLYSIIIISILIIKYYKYIYNINEYIRLDKEYRMLIHY